MSKKKRYEYFDRKDEDLVERRARKKATRDTHIDHWRFNPKDTYTDDAENENEIDDWEGHPS